MTRDEKKTHLDAEKRAPLAPAPKGWRRLLLPYDPLTSLVLTMPVFLVYHLGLLTTDLRNGVDLVSGMMVHLIHQSLAGYILLTLLFAAGVVAAGGRLRGRHRLDPKSFGPVLAESTVWAFVLLVSVGWLTARIVPGAIAGAWLEHAIPLLQLGPRTMGPIERVVMASGAGFHEELIFRVLFFGGGALLLERFARLSPLRAGLVPALVSSFVFSAVHYVGSLGDAFTISSFVFRFFMGLAFVLLYRYRGFAVAVWTHTIYDLLIFFVFGSG